MGLPWQDVTWCIRRGIQSQLRTARYIMNARQMASSARATGTWSSKEVRQTYLDFFTSRGHQYVHSSSVIPNRREGVYFVNAGMNQFKPIFLGTVDPDSDMADLRRAVNSQKCIRVGGKHNDLEDVGKDATHHTFFEMLGSWSFGDYFKKEACQMAWELLTKVYRLPVDDLYVTYFGGDARVNLPPDLECRDIWLELGVLESRVLPYGPRDNFWDMGETGPCGPCTEIHFDHIGSRDAASLVNSGDPRVVELWNLVFMTFDRRPDGSLMSLPAQHVDTGMGLERVTAVLQGHTSNYNTDLFRPLFTALQKAGGGSPYTDTFGRHDGSGRDTAYRIVADHARMATVAIADGLRPGRKDLDSKLRVVLHRACHQAHRVLATPPGTLARLVPLVVHTLGEAFPELQERQQQICDVVNQTEEQYLTMFDVGKKRVLKILKASSTSDHLTAHDLLDLVEGHSGGHVPVEVVCTAAQDLGVTVDLAGWETLQQQQQVRQTGGTPLMPDANPLTLTQHDVDSLMSRGVAPTDDRSKYTALRAATVKEARVLALKMSGGLVTVAREGDRVGVLLDRTLFYAEAGGQSGDQGTLKHQTLTIEVTDVQNTQNFVLHIGTVTRGRIETGQTVNLLLNQDHRRCCTCNHTATHVVNFALDRVLGDVRQQGSMVNEEKLVFDFTAAKLTVTREEVQEVAAIASDLVRRDLDVDTREVALTDADNITGLRMLANEVYPSRVRVVSIGTPVEDLLSHGGAGSTRRQRAMWSVELCGGTHVAKTGEIGDIVITHLQGMNQGTKRLSAVTGTRALQALRNVAEIGDHVTELEEWIIRDSHRQLWPGRVQQIDKMLTGDGGLLLPKMHREDFLARIARLKVRAVSREKNVGKLQGVVKDIGDHLSGSPDSTTVAIVTLNKQALVKEVVQSLVALAPSRPVMVLFEAPEKVKQKKKKQQKVSQHNLKTITGVCYVPTHMADSGLKAQKWAQHVFNFTKGHSLGPPAGKVAKAGHVHVVSFQEDGDRSTVAHAEQLARTFGDLYL